MAFEQNAKFELDESGKLKLVVHKEFTMTELMNDLKSPQGLSIAIDNEDFVINLTAQPAPKEPAPAQ